MESKPIPFKIPVKFNEVCVEGVIVTCSRFSSMNECLYKKIISSKNSCKILNEYPVTTDNRFIVDTFKKQKEVLKIVELNACLDDISVRLKVFIISNLDEDLLLGCNFLHDTKSMFNYSFNSFKWCSQNKMKVTNLEKLRANNPLTQNQNSSKANGEKKVPFQLQYFSPTDELKSEKKTSKPMTEMKASKPTIDAKTSNSTTKTKAAKPLTEMKVSKPTIDTKTSKSTTEMKTSKPMTEIKASKSTEDTKTSKPMTEIKASKSTEDTKTSKPMTEIKASKSTEDTKTSKPMTEIKASKSTEDMKTSKPMTEIKASKSTEHTKTSKPMTKMKDSKPTTDTKTCKPTKKCESMKQSSHGNPKNDVTVYVSTKIIIDKDENRFGCFDTWWSEHSPKNDLNIVLLEEMGIRKINYTAIDSVLEIANIEKIKNLRIVIDNLDGLNSLQTFVETKKMMPICYMQPISVQDYLLYELICDKLSLNRINVKFEYIDDVEDCSKIMRNMLNNMCDAVIIENKFMRCEKKINKFAGLRFKK